MTSTQRREEIRRILRESEGPISASALAGRFQVSRQIIVGDVALLRAANVEIAATPRGYVLDRAWKGKTYTIACRHDRARLARELYIVVDNGGRLLDVIVEHALYGQMSGQLHIFSRHDADLFLERLNEYRASPLSSLTDGIHLHTITCPDEAAYQRIVSQLGAEGILLEK